MLVLPFFLSYVSYMRTFVYVCLLNIKQRTMAQVYQLEVKGDYTQTQFDGFSHSLLFADDISPVNTADGSQTPNIVVTSNIESTGPAADYQLLADDSQSESSIDISTGKFVEGNLIAVLCTNAEAQSDLRDFMTFYAVANDNNLNLHIGVCNTTQSQDYTPDIVSNDRVVKMLTPSQVSTLRV